MTTAHQLASRDPAMAILTGAFPTATFGNDPYSASDFGYTPQFGAQFGAAPALPPHPAAAMHHVPTHPAAHHLPPHHAFHPANQAEVQHVWQQYQKAQTHTEGRERLIQPNLHSTIKIERYTFSLNQLITLGTPSPISVSSSPDTDIRPQRINVNSPIYQFVTLNEIKVGNVAVSVGGILDSFMYNANAVDQHMDLPTLSPSNKATVLGNYLGLTPPGFPPAFTYLFTVSLTGPSKLTA